MFWIPLAVAVSAPLPTNLHDWFNSKDVPAYVTQRGSGVWTVGVRVTVEPGGTIKGCGIESSSGIPDLDNLTCHLIADRAKFEPAQDGGSAILGIYRTSVQWAVANPSWDMSRMSNADLDVFVQSLPPSVHSPALIRTMFAVDILGRITSCTAEPGPGLEQIDNNSALASVACDQLTRTYRAIPAKDSSGKAIPSVQDAQVRFSVSRP
jgi:TonB family protein